MQIQDVSFTATDWTTVPRSEHTGTTGSATWRTIEKGNLRVRMVDYSPGYVADHWCHRGHVLLVLAGEVHTALEDGTTAILTPGMSYQVAEATGAHRSSAPGGATVFIVD